MILNLYRKLSSIAEKYIVVINSQIIYFPSGEPHKLRLFIVDGSTVDIWLSSSGKYSYHWERRQINKGIYRFDKAQHKRWEKIKTYPKHFHSGDELNVKESNISGKPEEAIKEILDFINSKLKSEK